MRLRASSKEEERETGDEWALQYHAADTLNLSSAISQGALHSLLQLEADSSCSRMDVTSSHTPGDGLLT